MARRAHLEGAAFNALIERAGDGRFAGWHGPNKPAAKPRTTPAARPDLRNLAKRAAASSPPSAPKTRRKPIGRMTDDEILDEMAVESARPGNDVTPRWRLLYDELGRREEGQRRDEAARAKIDQNLAKGMSYLDAYADAYDLDPAQLEAQDRTRALDAARAPGETRAKALRRMYTEWATLAYLQAESATRGHLLKPRSRSKGIDARKLFTGSAVYANAHASDELQQWWDANPRLSFEEFKATMLGGGSASGARKVRERQRSRL